jgi:hypothetical protein
MSRLRIAVRGASVPALVVLAVAALVANGCGGDTRTNGLEQMSAAAVQQKAAAALKSARSVHVEGTGFSDGATVRYDLRFDGASVSGALEAEGVRFALTRIGDIVYLKAGRQALKQLGIASAAARRVGADRWLKLDLQQLSRWEGLSLGDLAGQLIEYESPPEHRVTQATVDGRRVVVVSYRDGSKLFVANVGAGYPLRGDYKGSAAGRLDFTEYGADFRIAAPANAVDIDTLLQPG